MLTDFDLLFEAWVYLISWKVSVTNLVQKIQRNITLDS